MCRKRGATILAKVEARPGKSATFGGTHPQEREAKERAGAIKRKLELFTVLLLFSGNNVLLSFISSPYIINF